MTYYNLDKGLVSIILNWKNDEKGKILEITLQMSRLAF